MSRPARAAVARETQATLDAFEDRVRGISPA